jgi:hypothetical protein
MTGAVASTPVNTVTGRTEAGGAVARARRDVRIDAPVDQSSDATDAPHAQIPFPFDIRPGALAPARQAGPRPPALN